MIRRSDSSEICNKKSYNNDKIIRQDLSHLNETNFTFPYFTILKTNSNCCKVQSKLIYRFFTPPSLYKKKKRVFKDRTAIQVGINHGGLSRRQAGDINLKNGITSVRSAGLIGASLYHSAAVIDLQKAARWHTRVRGGTTEDARDRWRINLIKCCPHGGAWPRH